MPTLRALYEESNNKRLDTRISIGGQSVNHRNPTWSFDGFGIVPTANFELTKPLPSNIAEEDEVLIYAGFDGVLAQVFKGTIEGIERTAVGLNIEASGASRPLKRTYRRSVVTLAGVLASTAIANLFAAVGITNYLINLPAWTIGNNTPGELEFETYGDAVNQIAEVDGTPFWETPTGQTRVEVKDPIPSGSAFCEYFSGKLSALTAANRAAWIGGTLSALAIQPAGITNPNAMPRLRSVAVRSLFAEVKNKIIARGAVVTTTGGDGSDTSERIELTAQGPSPFIPSPPTYQEFNLDVPLVDDDAKLAEVAIRYFGLKNRLVVSGEAVVDGDPEIFLGATVKIEDPDYTGLSGNWFVAGYTTSVTDNDFITRLKIMGGQGIGNSPLISPIACFVWAVTGKQTQVLPVGIGPGGVGIIITFDGGCSQDFDGSIASYSWSDTEGNTGTGQYFQAAYDPASVSTVDVTLTVTDNDGLTDQTTRTVDVEGDDTDQGGGASVNDVYIFCAAEDYMMGTADGGATWNDISKAAAAVSGDFIKVASQFTRGVDADTPTVALFITASGEIVMTTDACVTSFKPIDASGNVIPNLTTLLPSPNTTWEVYPIPSTSVCAWVIMGNQQNALLLYNIDPSPGQIGIEASAWGYIYFSNIPGNRVNRAVSHYPSPTWVDLSEYLRGLNP